MLKARVLSSVVLVILMAGGIFAGSNIFAAILLLISVIGMSEIYKIYGINKKFPGFVGYFMIIVYDIAALLYGEKYSLFLIVAGLILCMLIFVACFPKYNTNQIMVMFFGYVYVGVMLSYVFRIRCMEAGFVLIWLVFICSWINDTCAYLVGVRFGKHKMSPKLSPKKSVEGAIGGIVGTALIAALYGYIFRNQLTNLTNPCIVCAGACALGAVVSMIGDLAASAIKRDHQVKDYGNVIPGHGGILDRFDSMIFTAPIIYWIVNSFANL